MTKKTRSISITLAIVVLIGAIAGATYMWFFNGLELFGDKDITAAIINLEGESKTSISVDNVLPGQVIDLEEAYSLKYTGNRYGILRIKIDENSVAELKGNIATHKDYLALTPAQQADYVEDATGVWTYTPERLAEIYSIQLSNSGVTGIDFFPNADGTALYALVAPGTDNVELLQGLDAKFAGEFGGGYIAPSETDPTPSRQFEQESRFVNGVNIDAFVVQCTREAVVDTMGQEALDEIEMIPALVNAIGVTPDARDSWAYVG